MRNDLDQLRRDAEAIFNQAVERVQPEYCIPEMVKRRNSTITIDRLEYDLSVFNAVYLIALGKAATGMYASLHGVLKEELNGGVVISNHIPESLRETAPPNIRFYEGTHPLPSETNIRASEEALELCRNTKPNDLVIFCISGGGSALLFAPKESVPYDKYRALVDDLMKRGATINELNSVRIALSRVKGGRLLSALNASTVINLIISDVIGDPPEFIASGPTVPPSMEWITQGTTIATGILEKYNLDRKYHEWLSPALRDESFTDPDIEPVTRIVGSNRLALQAAKQAAGDLGYSPMILSSRLEGESRELGHLLGTVLLEVYESGNPLHSPCCILSGGETTVSVSGSGKGGRNQELALGAAGILRDTDLCVLLSGGTDGIDGPTDAAGAIVDSTTAFRAVHQELSIVDSLHENDSYHFFQVLDDLLQTGPTGTNVMDIQIGLVG